MADGALDVREIFARLPHRYPILLVDRVIEAKAGHRLVAVKNVTVNEDYFRGHFPGNPIMPGVLVLESLAQAAGLLVATSGETEAGAAPLLVGVDQVKFRRPVVPGDRLHLEVDLLQRRGKFWRFAARAVVDGERAAEARAGRVGERGEHHVDALGYALRVILFEGLEHHVAEIRDAFSRGHDVAQTCVNR